MDCLNNFFNDDISVVNVPSQSLLFDIEHKHTILYPHIFPKKLFRKINSKKWNY